MIDNDSPLNETIVVIDNLSIINMEIFVFSVSMNLMELLLTRLHDLSSLWTNCAIILYFVNVNYCRNNYIWINWPILFIEINWIDKNI